MGSSCSSEVPQSFAAPPFRSDSKLSDNEDNDSQLDRNSAYSVSRTTNESEYVGSRKPLDEEERHETLESLNVLDTVSD